MDYNYVIVMAIPSVVVLILLLVNIVDRRRADKIQSKLLDRLMSRDFTEYVHGTKVMNSDPPEEEPDMSEEALALQNGGYSEDGVEIA